MSIQNDPRMAKRDSESPKWYMKDQQEWPEMAQNRHFKNFIVSHISHCWQIFVQTHSTC